MLASTDTWNLSSGAHSRPRPSDVVSHRFRNHLDGAAGAFLGADAAALAIVQVELETHARPELDHGIVGTYAVAVVALEAVAAGQATPRLKERIALVEALHHLLEGRGAAGQFQYRSQGLGRFAVIPGVELVGGGDLVFRRRRIGCLLYT